MLSDWKGQGATFPLGPSRVGLIIVIQCIIIETLSPFKLTEQLASLNQDFLSDILLILFPILQGEAVLLMGQSLVPDIRREGVRPEKRRPASQGFAQLFSIHRVALPNTVACSVRVREAAMLCAVSMAVGCGGPRGPARWLARSAQSWLTCFAVGSRPLRSSYFLEL